jgi:hypothetical protein
MPTTYGTPTDTPAHRLYQHVMGRSSDLGERLAILSGLAKTGQASARVAEQVRQWLWDDYAAAGRTHGR